MKKEYVLEGLCCNNCARKIESAAKNLKDVTSAKVDVKATTLLLDVQGDGLNMLEDVRCMVGEIEADIKVIERPKQRGLFKAWR